MKRIIPALLALAFLAGCATPAGYQAALGTWVGAPESTLLSAWGAPDSFYESEGLKYLTYRRIEGGRSSGPSFGYGVGFGSHDRHGTSLFSSLNAGDDVITQCKTTFILRQNIIQDWRYEGNGCRALRLTPAQIQGQNQLK